MGSILARVSGLTLLIGLVLLLCVGKCAREPVAPVRRPLTVLAPEKVFVHDTTVVVKIQEKVVVRRVLVPSVKPDADGKPKYHLDTPELVVSAKTDSAGLEIDSLVLKNNKTVLVGIDKNGAGMLQVLNSNKYFESANIEGYQFKLPVYHRVTYGLQAGVYLTPVGPMVGVGVGVNFALSRRK